MDLYILNSSFRRESVVDDYLSLVWSERYNSAGDFVLVLPALPRFKRAFLAGTYVSINLSDRVMTVKTIEETLSEDGAEVLTIKGFSLETMLDDRVALYALEGSDGAEPWEIEATPAEVMRTVFNHVVVQGALNPADTIPQYDPVSTLPPGSIPEPDEVITTVIEPASVYETLKKFGEMYNLGFRLYLSATPGKLNFDVYTGDDRTSGQSANSRVTFSKALGNLTGTSELTSIEQVKNVAYVIAKNGSRLVYANDDALPPEGLARRVLLVKADDIEVGEGSELDAAMLQRGKEELAKYRVIFAFDGEIPQVDSYDYRTHYNLGDIVEKKNDDGGSVNLRVTEQIFSRDSTGFKSYPTLSIDRVIEAGTWLAQPAMLEWPNAQGEWATYE